MICILFPEGFKNQSELMLGRHHAVLVQDRNGRAAYSAQGIIEVEGHPVEWFELEGIHSPC